MIQQPQAAQYQVAARVMSFKQAKVICHCCPFSQAPGAAPYPRKMK